MRRHALAIADELVETLEHLKEEALDAQSQSKYVVQSIDRVFEFMYYEEGNQLTGREMLQIKDAIYHLITLLPKVGQELYNAQTKINSVLD